MYSSILILENILYNNLNTSGLYCRVTMECRRNLEDPYHEVTRGGSRTAATSKVELFVIIVNGFQPLFIISKIFTLNVAAVLDLPVVTVYLMRLTLEQSKNVQMF